MQNNPSLVSDLFFVVITIALVIYSLPKLSRLIGLKMITIKDTYSRTVLWFLFLFNSGLGFSSIFFPLDIAAIEIDFSTRTSFYDSLPADTSPGVLNLTFWTGTLSGMMRMGGAFRLALGLGFGLILLTGPDSKWPIFHMAIIMNVFIIIIVYFIEPGQAADGVYTSSGTDNARLFQILHLILILSAYYRLKSEGVNRGMKIYRERN